MSLALRLLVSGLVAAASLEPLAPGVGTQVLLEARRGDCMNTSGFVRAAILHALKEARIELPGPDARTVAPGDVERWRAVLGRKPEASLP